MPLFGGHKSSFNGTRAPGRSLGLKSVWLSRLSVTAAPMTGVGLDVGGRAEKGEGRQEDGGIYGVRRPRRICQEWGGTGQEGWEVRRREDTLGSGHETLTCSRVRSVHGIADTPRS